MHGHHPSSPSPAFRQVKLHASPGEARARPRGRQESVGVSKGQGKVQATPPHTPRAGLRELKASMDAAVDHEDHDLSPLSSAANSVARGSLYEASTTASTSDVSGTKILLKASEMIHAEVKQCETRLSAVLHREREAREFSCMSLRRDVAAMVTIVEQLSAKVHKVPSDSPPDARLDSFLEHEKRARDALREDVEALSDQICALDQDRLKDLKGVAPEDLIQERADRASACSALRTDLDALTSLTDQERHARDLSTAVLRRDFRAELDALAAEVRQSMLSQLDETRIDSIVEHQRAIADATSAELRKDLEDLAKKVGSLSSAGVVNKLADDALCSLCTGALSKPPAPSNGVQDFAAHQSQQQHEQMEVLVEQLRLDLASSSQVISLRLGKTDESIKVLQNEMQISQALQRCLVDAVRLDS